MEIGIQLDELYPLQAELDQEIHKKHGVDYPSTFERRVLALLVEVGEFANETRCFKFWSLKGPSPKEKILDEYADGLHFFLSLGIPLGVTAYKHFFTIREKDLSRAILDVYDSVTDMRNRYDHEHYSRAFGDYLNIIPLLNVSSQAIIDSYLNKLGENFKRQDNHY